MNSLTGPLPLVETEQVTSLAICEVLQTIEEIGRGALTEMRRLVGMLREDGEDQLSPQPGLGDLPRLAAQVREAGLPVELAVEGNPRQLPVGIELSAYRIVQEALTNALKHAGDANALVRGHYGDDTLELATRVGILTTFGLDEYVYESLRAGASGFLLKDAPPEEIAAAVHIVARGEALLAPAVTRTVIEEFARTRPAQPASLPTAVKELTPREREVLDLLARGLSNPEICAQLVISEATTKTHVARILQKLDLRDRVQAVIYAYEHGIVHPAVR